MAMKFGSALFTKLMKKNAKGQRERDASSNKPFVLAIADFHKPASEDEPDSMICTQSALWQYLYGHRVHWRFEGDALIMERHDIGKHAYGDKEIPSGFFDLKDAENVSAVVFSNAGTIAKLDRMGVVAGFAAPSVKYYRFGLKASPDPNAVMGTPFFADVMAPDYEEYWTDELQVFHNPNAKKPIAFDWLPGAVHHHMKDGMLQSFTPEGTVLSSITHLITLASDDATEQP